MSTNNCAEKPDLRFLVQAWISWLFSAVFFLLLFGFLIAKSTCSSTQMAYLSSLLSFLAAAFSGLFAVRTSKYSALLTGLICGVSTLILLLALGLLLDRKSLDSGSVLSLVSFTLAGYLVGTVFLGNRRGRHKSQHAPQPGKRRNKG